MVALFAAYATFFAGFEQGGASLNLFAERYTDRHVLGFEVPAGVLQGATAFYTILFAPLFAALWLALGRRGKDFAPSTKFAAGLALLAAGYLVLYVASGTWWRESGCCRPGCSARISCRNAAICACRRWACRR